MRVPKDCSICIRWLDKVELNPSSADPGSTSAIGIGVIKYSLHRYASSAAIQYSYGNRLDSSCVENEETAKETLSGVGPEHFAEKKINLYDELHTACFGIA